MEKNDLVRVIAHQTSVFRGDEWSHLSIDIKIGKALLLSSSQYAIGTHHFLSARLEKVGGKSDLLQLAVKSEGIKMTFDRGNFVGNDKSKCRIMDDPWNRLTCQLKTCLFDSGEKFRVIVDACVLHKGDQQTSNESLFYGVSQVITATDFALEIKEKYGRNSCDLEEGVYSWYKSKGGKNTALSAKIGLKHTTGERRSDKMSEIKVELMYSDGLTAAPIYQLRDESKSKRILNILSPPTTEIKCSPFEDLDIHFRIEEVSFFHADRGGFKLKVSVPHVPGTEVVHPAVSDKVIFVLSKPNNKKKKHLRKKSTRHHTIFLPEHDCYENRNLNLTKPPPSCSLSPYYKRIRKGEQTIANIPTYAMEEYQQGFNFVIPINHLETTVLDSTFGNYKDDDNPQTSSTRMLPSNIYNSPTTLTESKQETASKDLECATADQQDMMASMFAAPTSGIREDFPLFQDNAGDLEGYLRRSSSGLLVDHSDEEGELFVPYSL